MIYEAKIETEYNITVSDPDKFLSYFTSEEYSSTFFDFPDMGDILKHLIMQFDSMDGSIDSTKRKYYKSVEGFGVFYFDNRKGWSTTEQYDKECGFSICISEKESVFDRVFRQPQPSQTGE